MALYKVVWNGPGSVFGKKFMFWLAIFFLALKARVLAGALPLWP